VVFKGGAVPEFVFHVTLGQVMVYAVPSSIIRSTASPDASESVGVELPDNVQVWIPPFDGSSAGVVPDKA
jgi:hypothetical protein